VRFSERDEKAAYGSVGGGALTGAAPLEAPTLAPPRPALGSAAPKARQSRVARPSRICHHTALVSPPPARKTSSMPPNTAFAGLCQAFVPDIATRAVLRAPFNDAGPRPRLARALDDNSAPYLPQEREKDREMVRLTGASFARYTDRGVVGVGPEYNPSTSHLEIRKVPTPGRGNTAFDANVEREERGWYAKQPLARTVL